MSLNGNGYRSFKELSVVIRIRDYNNLGILGATLRRSPVIKDLK